MFIAATPAFVIPAAIVLGAIIVIAIIIWSMYKVAEPNEALIISGIGAKGNTADRADSLGFKIISGGGSVVFPVVQTVRSLSLDQRQIPLELISVTNQAIQVQVKGVVIYKVADDYASIANAARRFLDKQNDMDASVRELSHGQLRTIVGSMTVEQLISDREALRASVLTTCQEEMQKLGLHVDSFQIQEIKDVPGRENEAGYIENLGRPKAAEVAKQARIAEAEQAREATQKEQENGALVAEATQASEVRQSKAFAAMEQAKAEAAQSGPLAEAVARQKVIQASTEAAKLESDLTEQKLQTEIRRPADAKAYEQVTLAEAQRASQVKQAEADAEQKKLSAEAEANATKVLGAASADATLLKGEAEAKASKAKNLAEADGIKAKNEALTTNSEAVIQQQIAEQFPEIVAAAARQYDNIDQLIVLDGAEGLSKSVAGTIGAASSLLPVANQIVKNLRGEGKTDAPTEAPKEVAPVAVTNGNSNAAV